MNEKDKMDIALERMRYCPESGGLFRTYDCGSWKSGERIQLEVDMIGELIDQVKSGGLSEGGAKGIMAVIVEFNSPYGSLERLRENSRWFR